MSMSKAIGHYEILGATPTDDFRALKRAYYRRAKECHPDRFGGDRAKEEEFKCLVQAFNVLSDPLQRRKYDRQRSALGDFDFRDTPSAATRDPAGRDERSILDSPADDILEELIVGNTIPRGTSLATLMMDLEKTDRFCLFREAKTYFYQGNHPRARAIFHRYVQVCPQNILAHYYLGRCLVRAGQPMKAQRELRKALRIGWSRTPPLRMERIHRELRALRKKHKSLLSRVLSLFEPSPPDLLQESAEDELRRRINREMDRLTRRRGKFPKQRKRLPR